MSDLKQDFDTLDSLPDFEPNTAVTPSKTAQTGNKLASVNEPTAFSGAVDQAKLNVLHDAQENDSKFVDNFKEKLKDATLKLAEVEKSKAELEKQNVEYAKEILETQQALNEQRQEQDKWNNRQKRREFHYDGVKPIMEFVGIKTPMNLLFLYALTAILVWFFLLSKLLKGTIGALIAGASDGDRPKAAKAFMWTLLAVFLAVVLVVIGYLGYQWLFNGTAPL